MEAECHSGCGSQVTAFWGKACWACSFFSHLVSWGWLPPAARTSPTASPLQSLGPQFLPIKSQAEVGDRTEMLWPGGSRHKSRSGAKEVAQALPGKLGNTVAGTGREPRSQEERQGLFRPPGASLCLPFSRDLPDAACLSAETQVHCSWRALQALALVLTVTCRGLRTLTWSAADTLSTPREQHDLGWRLECGCPDLGLAVIPMTTGAWFLEQRWGREGARTSAPGFA